MWPTSFNRPLKKKDHTWLSDNSPLQYSKNQELVQIQLHPQIQFRFDVEKVVQNTIQQRTKLSSPQFWKVTFLRSGLFWVTCLGDRHSLRLIAWQRAMGTAGLSWMFCSWCTHGARPLSEHCFSWKIQVLKYSIFNDGCSFRPFHGGWREHVLNHHVLKYKNCFVIKGTGLDYWTVP